MRLFCLWIAFISSVASLCAQPSSEAEILAAYQLRRQMAASSLLRDYPVRNIGPTVQGGRIVDIDVNLKHTKEFYIAFASGGIFKTRNNGITFDPVFDNQDALGIGDFALSQNNADILYVGTGEKNSSRSSYAGSGVYKTTDGGKSWQHLGLTGTQHISKVLIHPTDDNTVWVAAAGPLYSHSPHGGVYKSADGGKTWKKTLFVNDSTGIIDLVIDPTNPQVLLASSWERTRKAWHFKGSGNGSALYRSEDGGETWVKSVAGFPQGDYVGRIGLEICPSKPSVVYAVLDNLKTVEEKRKDEKKDTDEKLKFEDLRKMSKEDYLKLDDKVLNEVLRARNFPKKYTATLTKKEVHEGKYTPKAIADYFGADANEKLFRTKIAGAELYRSDDSGKSWKKMNSYDLDGVFFSYGYYFAEMKVSPDNADLLYLYGVPLLKSRDGGMTWHRLDTLKGVRDVHVDHHALWINPHDPEHILLGNDGGLYQSYDEGATWMHINNIPAGQFYTVSADMETPYNVYGGLQDNGVLKGSSQSIPNETKHWKPLFSGDGMYVWADPRNAHTVYTGYQFGNYYRLELDKRKPEKITPQHDIGEPALRWNWRAPLIMSKHNADILYIAANKVFRSLNKGADWDVVSPDLTKNKKSGNVPISTITALAESPLKFGLLYAGTDDGNLWVSVSSGGHWEPIGKGLPENLWVSAVYPSPHHEATVFVSLNGYREDDFRTYIFMSTDYGKTWESISGNLPSSVANVVIQDPVEESLLYCGLDQGTYVSLDKGKTWHLFTTMLNVSAYDMLVHPREHELVVATHGRSIFVADVKPLRVLKKVGLEKAILAFGPQSVPYREGWGEKQYAWAKENKPEAKVLYYVGKPSPAVAIEVYDAKNTLVRTLKATGDAGFHEVKWDLKVNTPDKDVKPSKKTVAAPDVFHYAGKGTYRMKFINGSSSDEVTVEVK